MTIYLIGSLRNPRVPEVAAALREAGHDVFDDWYAAGPEADDYWQQYEQQLGRSLPEALIGYACWHTFSFDLYHLERCDAGVLVMPAGKSGHLELGYICGRGKPTYVLFETWPERWDVMYRFCTGVVDSVPALVDRLRL